MNDHEYLNQIIYDIEVLKRKLQPGKANNLIKHFSSCRDAMIRRQLINIFDKYETRMLQTTKVRFIQITEIFDFVDNYDFEVIQADTLRKEFNKQTGNKLSRVLFGITMSLLLNELNLRKIRTNVAIFYKKEKND